MTFLKLLLSSSIIYLAIIAIASPIEKKKTKIKGIEIDEESEIMRSVLNNKSSNISDYIIPIHYKMKLMLLNDYLYSKCKLTLNISYAKQYINFYVLNSTNIIRSKLKKTNGTIYKTKPINPDKNNIVLLDFGDVLLRGVYDLHIDFIIPINIVRESFGTPYINEDEEIK